MYGTNIVEGKMRPVNKISWSSLVAPKKLDTPWAVKNILIFSSFDCNVMNMWKGLTLDGTVSIALWDQYSEERVQSKQEEKGSFQITLGSVWNEGMFFNYKSFCNDCVAVETITG